MIRRCACGLMVFACMALITAGSNEEMVSAEPVGGDNPLNGVLVELWEDVNNNGAYGGQGDNLLASTTTSATNPYNIPWQGLWSLDLSLHAGKNLGIVIHSGDLTNTFVELGVDIGVPFTYPNGGGTLAGWNGVTVDLWHDNNNAVGEYGGSDFLIDTDITSGNYGATQGEGRLFHLGQNPTGIVIDLAASGLFGPFPSDVIGAFWANTAWP